LNPTTGHEFSIVGGLTYNFENTHTNYQNGVDWHVDWAASQVLSKQFFVGPAGYFYGELSGDSGSGDKLGPFESSTVGLGGRAGASLSRSERLCRSRHRESAERLEPVGDAQPIAGTGKDKSSIKACCTATGQARSSPQRRRFST
jgi:hypothetical protein